MLRFVGGSTGPVILRRFAAETIVVLVLADGWSHDHGVAVDVNAIDNGTHGPRTLHGLSRAWDLDTDGERAADLRSLYQYLRAMLPPGYDVVDEKTHVHVEWQPKR